MSIEAQFNPSLFSCPVEWSFSFVSKWKKLKRTTMHTYCVKCYACSMLYNIPILLYWWTPTCTQSYLPLNLFVKLFCQIIYDCLHFHLLTIGLCWVQLAKIFSKKVFESFHTHLCAGLQSKVTCPISEGVPFHRALGTNSKNRVEGFPKFSMQ